MALSPRFFAYARRYERKQFILTLDVVELFCEALPVFLVLLGLMSSENSGARFVLLLTYWQGLKVLEMLHGQAAGAMHAALLDENAQRTGRRGGEATFLTFTSTCAKLAYSFGLLFSGGLLALARVPVGAGASVTHDDARRLARIVSIFTCACSWP